MLYMKLGYCKWLGVLVGYRIEWIFVEVLIKLDYILVLGKCYFVLLICVNFLGFLVKGV